MRHLLLHAVWLPVLLCACKTGGDGADDTDSASGATSTLPGTWQAGDGDVFAGRDLGDIAFLKITAGATQDSGFFTFYASDAASHALSCPQELWAAGSDGTLMLTGEASESTSGTSLYLFDQPDKDTLTITDSHGIAQTFTRTDAVTADATCGSVEVAADQTFDISKDYWSNLLWDGSQLLVGVEGGGDVPLNMSSGAVGTAVDFGSSYEHLLTMQGGDAWGTCACGNNTEIARTSPGGVQVDLVDTQDLGLYMDVQGAVFDGTHLIVTGYNFDDSSYHMLVVDSDADPNTLVRDVDMSVGGLIAVQGGAIYMLLDQRIVRLTSDGVVDATWQLPPALAGVNWDALTSDGTSMFVGGPDLSGIGYRVVKLTVQ